MTDWREIVEFHRDCDKWENILKEHCVSIEEEKVISDCFSRRKDQFKSFQSYIDNVDVQKALDELTKQVEDLDMGY